MITALIKCNINSIYIKLFTCKSSYKRRGKKHIIFLLSELRYRQIIGGDLSHGWHRITEGDEITTYILWLSEHLESHNS